MSRLCRLSLAIAVALAVAAPVAVAAPRVVQASGHFDVVIDPASVTAQPLPGGRCRITLHATFIFTTGALQGRFKPPALFEIMKVGVCDPAVPALETFVASGTFEGAVAGVSGRFGFVFRGTIDAANMARGQLVVTSGSGGLAGLRGTVQLSGLDGCCGSYSGVLVL
jgi:hypothetical protein